MPRTIVCIGLASLFGLGAGLAQPQAVETPTQEPTSEQIDQLKNIREGLVDPEARPKDRQRWADVLFSQTSPQAKSMIVELLGMSGNPDVQRALCGVIADCARRAPERLDAGILDPLIELLGAEADDLRAMAAEALVDFPGADVPARLGELASQPEAPLTQRLSAIDALAPNTHRREVTGQLISLLDAGVPEITERVVAALEWTTPETFGLDLHRWQQWWREKSQLTKDAWLAEQLQSYRERSRRIADELQTYREHTLLDHGAITTRIRGFQRELFRAVDADQREMKLAEWLDDPLPVVKLTALAIIRARMADEGKRPEGQVLAMLLEMLEQGSPHMRREVLEIVQNLNDPAVMGVVLAQLEQEEDPATRHAILKAIGKLNSPEAIPALIREIAALDSSRECIREAANALGQVAAKADSTEHVPDTIAALRSRYHAVPDDDIVIRAALLRAMAGVGDPAFAAEFLDAVESDDATVLRPAIQGVRAVHDTSKLPRLRTLTAHADPLVRLAAIEAVGKLGREKADLESLLTRLNPKIEGNDVAREAAWNGFREILSSRPIGERIQSAERLRDVPDLEVRYLEELADELSAGNGNVTHRESVLERLATSLVAQGRHAAAVDHLQTLYVTRTARSEDDARAYGLRLLDAMLRGLADRGVAELIRQLAEDAQDETEKAEIVETVALVLESEEMRADVERTRGLLTVLQPVPSDLLGDTWVQLLDRVTARLEPEVNGTTDPPTSPGD